MTSFLAATGNKRVPFQIISDLEQVREMIEDGSQYRFYLIKEPATARGVHVLKQVVQGAAVIRNVASTQLQIDGEIV